MILMSVTDILHNQVPSDQEIRIGGWVRTRRDSKAGISFLSIYDGSCLDSLQVVTSNTLPNYNAEILRLTPGCSVNITGRVVLSPGRTQKVEIQAISVAVIGWVEDPHTYPIAAKWHSLEYLRAVAHLRPRTSLFGAVARVRHTLAQALHRFLHQQGYLWVPTPIITTSNTEGAGEMFCVSTLDIANVPRTSEGGVDFRKDFFGKKTFLTVSGQLNGEAYACALSKIYTFGPTFRAENSNTRRHLAEFWMIEPELAFADLNDAVTLAERILKYVFQAVLTEREDEMMFFSEHVDSDIISRLERCILKSFIEIDYSDVIGILNKSEKEFKNPIQWGMSLSAEHERYLAEKYFQAPVVVKNYPKETKAFYMRLNKDYKTVAAVDILLPGIGEIIGGSQREERLDILDARIKEMGLNPADYNWYRDLRLYGTVPHAGFGLGFERLISYVTGLKNIRDVIPFPRTTGDANF